MDTDAARRAISLVDLTNLTDDCTPADITDLCRRARRWGTAAVCVWPDFVAQCVDELESSGIRVATVVNFPTGDERPFAVSVITERALADGADEIDVVLPYRAFAEGGSNRPGEMLDTVRRITAGRAVLKVILETGELKDLDLVRRAARVAIEHGADFVKTSTGKSPVSATIDAAEVMLGEIAAADRPVGIKPAGGISTADDAARYIEAADRVMGEGWATPSTFRFGASGLLNALIEAAGESPDQVVSSTSSY